MPPASNALEVVEEAKVRWEVLHAIVCRELNAFLETVGASARVVTSEPRHEMPLNAAWRYFRAHLDPLRGVAPEIDEAVPNWLDYLGWRIDTRWELLPEPRGFFPVNQTPDFWDSGVKKTEKHAVEVRGVFDFLIEKCPPAGPPPNPDGPTAGCLFSWKNRPYPFPSLQWALLNCLWNKPPVPVEDVLEAVWGEGDHNVTKLKKLRSDFEEKCLVEHNLPIEINWHGSSLKLVVGNTSKKIPPR